MRLRSRARSVAVEAAAPIVLVLLVGVLTARSEVFYYPPLTDVLSTFADTWLFERVGSDVVPSLSRMAAGFAIACIAGVVGGMALGASRRLRIAADPVVSSCARFRRRP